MPERQTSGSILNPERKVISETEAGELSRVLREEGKTVVFTNGCFDIIHAGHAAYLLAARKLGDILLVGLNSDNSVRRIKGAKRPIVPENERRLVLASFAFVDRVIVFGQDTPYELIKKIKPHVLVKGEDWNIEEIAGSDFVLGYGGEVITVPFVEGLSTSKIIERIIEAY